jgi:hypothetical protein
MIAAVGGIWKVAGKSMAIAPTGPIPGRTPMRVPNNAPKKQDSKLIGWNPTEKP